MAKFKFKFAEVMSMGQQLAAQEEKREQREREKQSELQEYHPRLGTAQLQPLQHFLQMQDSSAERQMTSNSNASLTNDVTKHCDSEEDNNLELRSSTEEQDLDAIFGSMGILMAELQEPLSTQDDFETLTRSSYCDGSTDSPFAEVYTPEVDTLTAPSPLLSTTITTTKPAEKLLTPTSPTSPRLPERGTSFGQPITLSPTHARDLTLNSTIPQAGANQEPSTNKRRYQENLNLFDDNVCSQNAKRRRSQLASNGLPFAKYDTIVLSFNLPSVTRTIGDKSINGPEMDTMRRLHDLCQDSAPIFEPSRSQCLNLEPELPARDCNTCGFDVGRLLQLTERALWWSGRSNQRLKRNINADTKLSEFDKSDLMLRLHLEELCGYALGLILRKEKAVRNEGKMEPSTLKSPCRSDEGAPQYLPPGEEDTDSKSSVDVSRSGSPVTENGSAPANASQQLAKAGRQHRGRTRKWTAFEEELLRSYMIEQKELK
ncbi:hypothetical protein BKA67DRAFT_540035 [Truncatella angustata]|uniref:Uncharacterized protein n=1 Tax=Truncatella angustata TaxID=152316 RepID=A0A9P8UD00_9PEZI|nr:uncharacterized protein BKA67DRAFT_540035 [Truncatella angustata]KAH6646522.1 hypothetical protein BKA67DRAFT_540035 [Truncatella angustata]